MAVEGRGGGGARGGGWVGVGEDGAMDDAKYMPCLEGGRVLPTSRQGAENPFPRRFAPRRFSFFLKNSYLRVVFSETNVWSSVSPLP